MANLTSRLEFNISYSWDGTKLVFISDLIERVPDDFNRLPDIYVLDLDTGKETRVSTKSSTNGKPGGAETHGYVDSPGFSPDGESVVFTSNAYDIDPADSDGRSDVYVKNLKTGKTTWVSTAEDGTNLEVGSDAARPVFSPDGKSVMFESTGFLGYTHLYLKNLATGKLEIVSKGDPVKEGDPATAVSENLSSTFGSFSADGKFILFQSTSDNLDRDVIFPSRYGDHHIYLSNLKTGAVDVIDKNINGGITEASSRAPTMSEDGTKILFSSEAENLVKNDTNEATDLFLYDRIKKTMTLVSTDAKGKQLTQDCFTPVLSPDGTKLVFASYEVLDAKDTNQAADVFLKDLNTGALTRLSTFGNADPGETSQLPRFSPDGGYVVWSTALKNKDGDFIHNRFTYEVPSIIFGEEAADTDLVGTRRNDRMFGLGGNDKIKGLAGNDAIDGGKGADTLIGGLGNDTYDVDNAKDVVKELAKQGTDIVKSSADFTLSAFVENLTLIGGRNIGGTGNGVANTIIGNAGNNLLKGAGGNDRLDGGAGNDALLGGTGTDKLIGGAGNDTASYATAAKGVMVSLAKPNINTGDAKGDTFSSIENLTGGKFGDKLTANGAANTLTGGAGSDRLTGGAGADNLYGGDGKKGLGSDIFVFTKLSDSTPSSEGRDTIYDFASGDRFDLSAIDANGGAKGSAAFAFIGSEKFHGKAGELRFDKLKSDTYVYADVNGDKKADFSIHLDDAVKLVKADFLL